MLQAHCNANNKTPIDHQSIVHIDSQWFGEIIALTGSMEGAMVLADTMIYDRNRYKAFKIGGQYHYGLLYSAKTYEQRLQITYRRAMNLPKELVKQGFLTPHDKKFIYNRTFYRPTKKLRDSFYKVHANRVESCAKNNQIDLENSTSSISIKTDINIPKTHASSYDKNVEPLVHIRRSGCANMQKPYKDKNKDKKNNNHNYLKNYSLLKNLKAPNVKTVIFDFKQFSLGGIESEASLLDYFTVKQNKVINTLIYCYHDTLDITVFNQMLHRSDLKKEAKDFKQLVSWAYIEATGKRGIVTENEQLEFTCNTDSESQSVDEMVIDYSVEHTIVEEEPQKVILAEDRAISETQAIENQQQNYRLTKDMVIDYSVEPNIVEDEIVEVVPNGYNHATTGLPGLTTADIQAMIEKRQGEAVQDIDTENKNQSIGNEVSTSKSDGYTDIEAKTSPSQSTYLLNQSNKLYLLKTLSKQGVNDAQLILKMAENIITEYPGVTFNDLLDGVVYRLVALPAKQRQQALMNEAAPMEMDSKDSTAVDCFEIANASKPEVATAEQPRSIESDVIADVQGVIGEAKPELIASIVIAAESADDRPVQFEGESQVNQETSTQKEYAQDNNKSIEFPDNFVNENPPNCLNHEHEKLLIAALDEAGITDKKLIVETATSIMAEYLEFEFKAVVECVIYRLVTLPEKQKRQHKNQQALLDIFTCENTIRPEAMTANQMPQTITKVSESALPTLADLTMPHVDRYLLRQDWASKADQNFYTGVLPESQQFALVAMLDYVKRQGVTITVDQEVYEWLYHMASNKDYYYSRAKNFKHWCNIAMKQLMVRRLNKPAGFNGWRSRIEAETLLETA